MTRLQAPQQPATDAADHEAAPTKSAGLPADLLTYGLIFILALTLRLWFNFLTPHVNAFNACDAWEYLSNAGAISHLHELPASFWNDCLACLAGSAAPAVKAAVQARLQPLQDLAMSGPTYPLFLWFSFLVAGAPFNAANWSVPLAAQSILSSITCLMVAGIGSNAWNKRVGLLAGLTAAIYPGFIINSGRLVTETFACFLLTLAVWLITRALSSRRPGWLGLLVLGATCGALQLTRPVLLLVAPLLIPVALVQTGWKKRLISLAVLAAGLASVLMPWLAWQTLSTGRPSLIVDRVSSYNFVVGNDNFTGGWAAIPLQTLGGGEKKSLTTLVAESVGHNPINFVRISLDKLARLYKLPFNDFRAPLGPFSPSAQACLHQLLLALAGCGLVLSLCLGTEAAPTREQLWCRALIVWAIVIHFAYLPFITVARYALTAMPFIIVLGAAGVVSLARIAGGRLASRPNSPNNPNNPNSRLAVIAVGAAAVLLLWVERTNLVPHFAQLFGADRITACLVATCALKIALLAALIFALWRCTSLLEGNRPVARALSLALGLLVLVPACLQTRVNGRWYEWQANLTEPGQKVVETIQLGNGLSERLKNRQGYLLVDTDGWQRLFKSGSVSVNGTELSGPVIPSLSLPDCIFWYATTPDGGVYRHYERVFSSLAMSAGLTMPDLRQWFLLPLPADALSRPSLTVEVAQRSHTPVKVFGTYALKKNLLQMPNPYNYSWEKAFYGVEDDEGLTDTRLDHVIARDTCPARSEDLSTAPGLQSGNFNIRLLVPPVDPASQDQHLNELLQTPVASGTISLSGNESRSVNLPLNVSYDKDALWLVRVSGRMKSGQTGSRPAVGVSINSQEQGGKSHRYISPWTPTVNRTDDEWVPFDFAFPVQPGSFPGKLTSVDVNCEADSSLLASLRTIPNKAGSAEFADLKLRISKMPALPTQRGYEVY